MIYAPSILVFLFLIAPGVRLLLLARETKRVPEFFAGLYFVGAAMGISLRVLGATLHPTNPEVAVSINTAGHLGLAAGTMAIAVFTQRVFHPESSRARLFAAVSIGAIIATTCHTLIGGYVSIEDSPSILATNTARILPTAWAFAESFRYWRAMRKRESLGLADPVVTNRFLLWTLWTGSVSFLPFMTLMLRLAAHAIFPEAPFTEAASVELQSAVLAGVRIVFVIVAPIAFVSLTLSFFPPKFYLDRVRSRAEAAIPTD